MALTACGRGAGGFDPKERGSATGLAIGASLAPQRGQIRLTQLDGRTDRRVHRDGDGDLRAIRGRKERDREGRGDIGIVVKASRVHHRRIPADIGDIARGRRRLIVTQAAGRGDCELQGRALGEVEDQMGLRRRSRRTRPGDGRKVDRVSDSDASARVEGVNRNFGGQITAGTD